MNTETRVFDAYSDAATAVSNLRAIGIPEANISLIGNRSVAEDHEDEHVKTGVGGGMGLGAAVGGGAGLLAGLGLIAIPGLGPVVAAGWLAATALGAVGGAVAGGLVGALVNAGVSEEDAHTYSETVRRGGTMVIVKYNDGEEANVIDALDGASPVDISTRRAQYEAEGWRAFDPKAEEYSPSASEMERMRRKG